MPTKSKIVEAEEKEAKHGEKMIEVRVRFWTNNIAEDENKVLPKHAWSSGIVRMERNKSHDIVPESPIPFNSLLELPFMIEELLLDHEITLHLSNRTKRYMKS